MKAKEFSLEKKTGIIIAVVIGAIVLFFILKLMNSYVFNKNTYYVLFDNASLIRQDAPVYIDKAVVGSVKELSLSPDRKKAVAKVRINKKINIPDKSIAEIFSTDPSKKNKAIRIVLFSSVKYLANNDTLANIPSATMNIPPEVFTKDTVASDTSMAHTEIPKDEDPGKGVRKQEPAVKDIPVIKKETPLKKSAEKNPPPTPKTEVIYKVQFLVSKNDYPPDHEVFKGITQVSKYPEGGVYKYLAGNETARARAAELLTGIKEKGFGDAFIVVLKNGKKLSGNEALHYLNK